MIRYGLAVAALILLIIGVMQITAAVPDLLFVKSENGAGAPDIEQQTFSAIDRALRVNSELEQYSFQGDYQSPLRPYAYIPRRVSARSGPQYVRPTLKLKGVLLKDDPLAIIQDQSGKTHICTSGDLVDEQEVVAIQKDLVRLRDRLGAYELEVAEE